MGRLTEDMARLRQNIDNHRESRRMGQADRSGQERARVLNVNTLIAEFASTRAATARQDAQARTAFIAENTNNVLNLVGQFRSDRDSQARQSGQARADFMAKLSQDTARLLADLQTTRSDQAQASAQQRAEFFSELAASIGQFLADTQAKRASDARLSAEERNRFATDLAGQVSSRLGDFHQALADMAKSGSEERAAFVAALVSNVAALIGEASEDRAGAHAAFFFSALPEKKKQDPKLALRANEESTANPAPVAVVETVQASVETPPPPVAETPAEPAPEATQSMGSAESNALWDSFVAKKPSSGDHEKSKKKHQAADQEKKPDET